MLTAALISITAALFAQQQSASLFDGKSWWEHVRVLADDRMEGRDTGSEGLRRAQAYVVEQLEKDGLRPAGVKGFYQPVKFETRRVVEEKSSLALERNGTREPLALGEDALLSSRAELAPELQAPLVFAGYGLRIPENNYDDFAEVNVTGKVVVYISGSPAEASAALASHYQSAAERGKTLRQYGAVGTIAIPNPASMDIPWSRMSLNRTRPSMALAGDEFRETAGQKLAVTFNPARAEKLFAGSGHTFAELAELAKDRKPLPRFLLVPTIHSRAKLEKTKVESANLVAVLPGSDPKLKDEYVALSAHLDHLGIGEPINGDRIYNGAMDNGAGSALLLDIAAAFQSHPEKLRRSILFLWVTAEEKGLLGSRYFAAHPTVPLESIVADVNVDMFLPILPLKVLCVLGMTDSDLGDRARAIVTAHGVQAQLDPEPLRNRFIRSDQYNFIQHGIPAVKMDNSFIPGSPEQKIFKDWLTNRYHAPSDDLDQPVDLAAAALYEQITRELLISVANSEARPAWKPDSFFRRYASQKTAAPQAGGFHPNDSIQVLNPGYSGEISPYLDQVLADVKKTWYEAIPAAARRGQSGKVAVDFSVLRDGSLAPSGPVIFTSSRKRALDDGCLQSVRAASPFAPLPATFKDPSLQLRIVFLYNLPMEAAQSEVNLGPSAATLSDAQDSFGLAYQLHTASQGLDFHAYLAPFLLRVKQKLFAAMLGRVDREEQESVAVNCKILRDGSVPSTDVVLSKRSHWKLFDNAARNAVRDAGPLDPFPQGFADPFVELGLFFLFQPPQRAGI